jgi:RimJ/RimL family protein N-acetyltransferase
MQQEFKLIQSKHGQIIIRTYELRDIPFHTAYLYDSSPDYLESIGFDPTKFVPREEWVEGLQKRRAEAIKNGDRPISVVAEFSGRAVSMVFLDLRNEDKVPRLHFHIFESELRGKGLGGLIFMSGVEAFSRIYEFKRFLIEPKANNQRMNGLMRKIGFRHVKDFLLAAGPVTHEFPASQYEIIV